MNSRLSIPVAAGGGRLQLRAAGLALGFAGGLVALGLLWAQNLEQRFLPALTAELSHSFLAERHARTLAQLEVLKNQGIVLQRAAFARADLLPLYGSSELVKSIGDKASIFFRNYPTGFTVFPVGRAGSDSLILAEKLAAVAPPESGRKVAISLSPSWFFTAFDPRAYHGNYSAQQALAALLNPRLSFGLKHDLARRMRELAHTADRDPLLGYLLDRLAEGRRVDRLLYAASLPLGWLEVGAQRLQEHVAEALELWAGRRLLEQPPSHEARPLDWARLEIDAAQQNAPWHARPHEFMLFSSSDAFLRAMNRHTEWADLRLLLRVLRELHLRPLLLTMPINGVFMEEQGISREALSAYAKRLHRITDRRGLPLQAFEDHLEDPGFDIDAHDHLNSKGWMFYNRALDEFMHSPAQRN